MTEPYLIKMLYQLKDDEYADKRHEHKGDNERFFGKVLKPSPSLLPAAAQGDMRVNSGCRKHQGIGRQQLFTVAFYVGEPPAHDENPDNRQADADKGCGNRENMDDDVEFDKIG